MDEQDLEIIREFVLESNENLGRLDQEIVQLESAPRDAELLASVFRTMHTLKGTCGFLGFSAMESVAHHAENILSQLRTGVRTLDPALTTVILEAVDMVRVELTSVEQNGVETGQRYEDLLERLRQCEEMGNELAAPAGTEEASQSAQAHAEMASDGDTANPEAGMTEEDMAEAGTVEEDTVEFGTMSEGTTAETAAGSAAGGTTGGTAGTREDFVLSEVAEDLVLASSVTPEVASSVTRSLPARKQDPASKLASAAKQVTAAGPATTANGSTGQKPSPTVARKAGSNDEEEDPSASQARGKGVADSAIRVDVTLLDKLMNLVGELVLARNQILQFTGTQEDASLNATSQRLDLITTELQEGVMKTRMQPIGVVWSKLPRVVRDLSSACNKQIRLEMDGAETELDKTIIEAIKDPLTHIVRNSCDHGIEDPATRSAAGKPPQGKLSLRAFHEGGHVNIEITDDGRGIDAERVRQRAVERGMFTQDAASRMSARELHQLIFAPGLSTAEAVSSISGRGVGMDVVRTNIEKIGGTVDVTSRFGAGTTVRLKIPLTLAIIPGLVITHQNDRYVIPQVSLLELIRLEGEQGSRQIERIHGTPVYRRRGKLLPLAFLADIFHSNDSSDGARPGNPEDSRAAAAVQGSNAPPEVTNIVVLQAETQQFGLVVDGINDTQEIVVKPLGKQLKGLTCYAGATIMGDGKVALILDVMGIGQLSGVLARSATTTDHGDDSVMTADERQNYLLFAAGTHRRLAVPLALVARLEEFAREDVERAAGKLVIQYRGQILPIVPLSALLDPLAAHVDEIPSPVRVVVFSEGNRSVGVMVDQILDIVEGDVSTRKPSSEPGVLASIVLGGKVTDLVDLKQVLTQESVDWFGSTPQAAMQNATVLIAEPESFRRNLLRSAMQLAGYRVREAANASEVIRALDQDGVDVALVSVSLQAMQDGLLFDWIRTHRAHKDWVVVAMHDESLSANLPMEMKETFDAWENVFDHQSMLRSIENLRTTVNQECMRSDELVHA